MAEPLQPARLRVAVLNRVFRTTGGGAETYSIRVAEQLAARHDIHVFAQEFEHDRPGLVHERVPRPFKRPRWLNQLWYALYTWHATRKGFDVVHSHENTWHGAVQTVHVRPVRGDLLGQSRGWDRAVRWARIVTSPRLASNLILEAVRFRPRPGRHLVLASDALRAQCMESYPASRALMSVISPGVTVSADVRSPAEARAALGLPPAGAVVLFVANDFARKGLDALLGAMARLPSDTTLAVVGSGSGEPYRERVRALGLAGRVHFLGARQDMDLAYRAATVLAHPTLGDTFAMVVLEAMARGVPVVVSGARYCGIADHLSNGEDALLIDEPRDEAALARALGRVLGEPALVETLRVKGLAFAASRTWDAAARGYEALYLQAARRSIAG